LTRAEGTAILITHNKEGTVSSSPPAAGEGVNMESNHRCAVLLCRVAEPFGSVFLCGFVRDSPKPEFGLGRGDTRGAAGNAAENLGSMTRRCVRISSKDKGHQINEDIRDKEVRLVSADGEQLGIMSAQEALAKAEEANLDLVKISPNAVPPVCKLMDYGKFKFEQTKREKEARKNQRVVEIKEVRMSPSIDSNDFNVKLRNAQKFLADGDRVKVTVRFRGREMAHTEIGRDLLLKFAEQCAEVASMDKEPKLDGRHMSIFLSSKTAKESKK